MLSPLISIQEICKRWRKKQQEQKKDGINFTVDAHLVCLKSFTT